MTGTTRARALELAAKLEAEGIRATTDPRSATPPCILVVPSPADLAGASMCTRDVTWDLWALAPGGNNADAWDTLDALTDAAIAALPIERYDPLAYTLAAGSDPLPAWRLRFTEGV